jgi:hypothetical protein
MQRGTRALPAAVLAVLLILTIRPSLSITTVAENTCDGVPFDVSIVRFLDKIRKLGSAFLTFPCVFIDYI